MIQSGDDFRRKKPGKATPVSLPGLFTSIPKGVASQV
jgi:hypothetical protein